jgi:pimeloyl-ACP methyl ester carboxylesterase
MTRTMVGEISLSYDLRGDGDAVLLICGTGAPAAIWDQGGVRPALDNAGYRTVAFDNRGMPPSDCPPAPYTVENLASDTIGLMETLGLSSVRIIGSSLGACIAQTVALRRPDLVHAAVLMVGGGNYSLNYRHKMQAAAAILRTASPEAADLYWNSILTDVSLLPSQQQDDDAVKLVNDLTAASFRDWGDPGRLGQAEADAKWAAEDHLSELAHMTVPCLFIAHEWDPVFPPSQLRRAADRTPRSDYVEIPDANHVALDPGSINKITAAILHFFTRP